MGKIICFIALKGGVAKSESCLNLAYGLSTLGKKVLVIDVDPQCNTTNILMAEEPLKESEAEQFLEIVKSHEKNNKPSFDASVAALKEYIDLHNTSYDIHHVIEKECTMKDAIVNTRYKNIDLVPSGQGLSLTDAYLKSGRTYKPFDELRLAIETIRDEYDVILLDNQPFKNALIINSISACCRQGDLVVIPVKFNRGGLEGTYETIDTIQEWLLSERVPLDIRLLATMVNRNKIDHSWVRAMKYGFQERMFDSTIRYQAKPIEDASMKKKILLETTGKGVAEDYWNLVNEVNVMI